MTKEDKFKLGLMGYEEYMEWQEELAEEAARQAELEAMGAAAEELLGEIGNLGEGVSESTESEKPATEKKSGNHTFWEDDDGDRENVSKEEFDNFLAQNSIDVSNSTAIDIDSLLSENS